MSGLPKEIETLLILFTVVSTYLTATGIPLLEKFLTIIERIRGNRKQDIECIQSLVKEAQSSNDSQVHYQEYLNRVLFQKCYGISAGEFVRSRLFDFVENYTPNVEWRDIKKAYPYIERRGNRLFIKLKRPEQAFYVMLVAFSVIFLVFSACLLIISSFGNGRESLLVFILGLFCYGMAISFSQFSLPYRSAEKIKPKLAEYQQGLSLTTDYKYVQINDRNVPIIAGTKMRVVELMASMKAYGWRLEELHANYPHLIMSQIHSALAYYWDHKEELDADTEQHYQYAEKLRREAGESPLTKQWQYLEKRPDSWRQQLYIKERRMKASTVWSMAISPSTKRDMKYRAP